MSSPTDDPAAPAAGRPATTEHDEAVDAHALRIGGFVPLSSVDWPGQLVATVFLSGCPWDCPYCHNAHLIGLGSRVEDVVAWEDVTGLLDARTGLLDGVVFSGGEPTLQPALLHAVREVRERGFAVALHTGGAFPDRFEALLPYLDWVGFDVKAPFSDYARVTLRPESGQAALASLRALVASGVPFEVRTTVHSELLEPDDLMALSADLIAEGVTSWFLQEYRPDGARKGLLGHSTFRADTLPPGLGDGFEEFGTRS